MHGSDHHILVLILDLIKLREARGCFDSVSIGSRKGHGSRKSHFIYVGEGDEVTVLGGLGLHSSVLLPPLLWNVELFDLLF